MIAAIAAQTTPGMAAPIQGAIAPETAMECEITEAAQRMRESAIPKATAPAQGLCYHTRLVGNSNAGHEFGTTLPQNEKDDLLAYLLTL